MQDRDAFVPKDRIDSALRWMDAACHEIVRAESSYVCVGGRIGEIDRYLRVKRIVFHCLHGDLLRAAPGGGAALVRALSEFRPDPVLAEEQGVEAFADVDAKRRRVTRLLVHHLDEGVPLPDPIATI